MRLDQYLVAHHGFPSRTKAAQAIRDGDVLLNEKIAKPSTIVEARDQVEILIAPHYVSRAADKLLEALESFKIDLTDKSVLDIGQSTGGFTQVALEAGAKQVIGIEVGQGQLDESLKNNPLVVTYEQTNLKDLASIDLPVIDVGVIDVSFISTIDHLPSLLPYANQWLCLIKPQFETKGNALHKGVVKDAKAIDAVLGRLPEVLTPLGYQQRGTLACRTKGKTGNQEYMVWVQKDVTRTVD